MVEVKVGNEWIKAKYWGEGLTDTGYQIDGSKRIVWIEDEEVETMVKPIV